MLKKKSAIEGFKKVPTAAKKDAIIKKKHLSLIVKKLPYKKTDV